ncbi:MAG: hypothetical protein JXQ83_10060 [Candidatus Glassbacteria bacterium]|nr:hypothetical protein [Candidatus Glassbacteria bacterium]
MRTLRKATIYAASITTVIFVAVLIVRNAGLERSEIRSDWLLEQYCSRQNAGKYDQANAILLFLRARYGAWQAGKTAAALLDAEATRLYTGCLKLSKSLPASTPFVFSPQAVDILKKSLLDSVQAEIPPVIDSIYVPREIWEKRCFYYPGRQVLGTLEQGSFLKLWDLEFMKPVVQARLEEEPASHLIEGAENSGFYLVLFSDTSGALMDLRQKSSVKLTPFITRLQAPGSFAMGGQNLSFRLNDTDDRRFEIHRNSDGELLYADYAAKGDPFILVGDTTVACYHRETGVLTLRTLGTDWQYQFPQGRDLDLCLSHDPVRALLLARAPEFTSVVDLESLRMFFHCRVVLEGLDPRDLLFVDDRGEAWRWKPETRQPERVPALESAGGITDGKTVVAGLAELKLADTARVLFDFIRGAVVFSSADTSAFRHVSFPGGNGALSIDGGGSLSIWSLKEGVLTVSDSLVSRRVEGVEYLAGSAVFISYRDSTRKVMYDYAAGAVLADLRDVAYHRYFPGGDGAFFIDSQGSLSACSARQGLLTFSGTQMARLVEGFEFLPGNIAVISYRDSSRKVIYDYAGDTVLAEIRDVESWRYFPGCRLFVWIDREGFCRLADMGGGFDPLELQVPAGRLALVLEEPSRKGLLFILQDGFFSFIPGDPVAHIFTALEPNPFFSSGRGAGEILDCPACLEVGWLKEGSSPAGLAAEGDHLRLTLEGGETLLLWHHRAPGRPILLPPALRFHAIDDVAMAVAWSTREDPGLIHLQSPCETYNRTLDPGRPVRNIRLINKLHCLLATLDNGSQVWVPYLDTSPFYRSRSAVERFESARYGKTLVIMQGRVLEIPHADPDNYRETVSDPAASRFAVSTDTEFLAWTDSASVVNLYLVGAEKIYIRTGAPRESGHGVREFTISPDSRLLAVKAGDSCIRLLDIRRGKWYGSFAAPDLEDSRLFFTYGSLMLEVNAAEAVCYDVEYCREAFRLRMPYTMRDFVFNLSPDGNTLSCKGEYRHYSINLAGVIESYLGHRGLSTGWAAAESLSGEDGEPTLWLRVDSTLIPAARGMAGIPGGGADTRLLVDERPLNSQDLSSFVLAGGYTIPGWWSAEGLSYTLAGAGISTVYPSSIPPPDRTGEEKAVLNWYEAQALAVYLGKRLPTPGQWKQALAAGVIKRGKEQAWEWCRPADTASKQGYEDVADLFKYPLLSPAAPDTAETSGDPGETWLVPGYFKDNTYARLVIE